MTLFDQLLRCADRWLERLDRERDTVTRLLHREGLKPHLIDWNDALEVERVKHLELMTHLQALRRANHPALLLHARPMVKALLKQARLKARAV